MPTNSSPEIRETSPGRKKVKVKLNWNRDSEFENNSSIHDAIGEQFKSSELLSLKVQDPESFLLKVIIEKMKGTKDGNVTQEPLNNLEKFKSQGKQFPSMRMMQSEAEENFQKRINDRKDNYMRYIEEKLHCAKEGKAMTERQKLQGPIG